MFNLFQSRQIERAALGAIFAHLVLVSLAAFAA